MFSDDGIKSELYNLGAILAVGNKINKNKAKTKDFRVWAIKVLKLKDKLAKKSALSFSEEIFYIQTHGVKVRHIPASLSRINVTTEPMLKANKKERILSLEEDNYHSVYL